MSNKVIVDRQFFLTLVEDAILTQDTTEDPSFEPDEQMGEGTASPEEHDYRAELLLLLGTIFPAITTILQSKASTDLKITQIDNQLSSFQSKAENLIGNTLPTTWRDAVTEANVKLKELKPGIRPVNPDKKQLKLLEQQQNSNIEDIVNFLQGRLTQGLMVDEIGSFYPDHQHNIDYLNPAFNNAQNRLDQLGMYGYLHTHQEGLLLGLMAGAVVIGHMIVADWVTMGDSSVCEDCQSLEDNSPYPVDSWPEDPHFGCRCEQGDIRLEGT